MPFPPDNLRRPRRRGDGFTLIEILIALAVLMLGVYGMLRVFPPGFRAIEASQQRTIAAQLAEAEITRWKLDPDSLPDAIVPTDYSGKVVKAAITNNQDNLSSMLVWGDAASLRPGWGIYGRLALTDDHFVGLDQLSRPFIYSPYDLTPSQFDALLGETAPETSTVHRGWQPNSLYLPRTVIGERIDIRSLGQTGPGVPFYLLSHAPLDTLRYEGAARRPVYLDIYDARPWRYRPYQQGIVLALREFTVDLTTSGQVGLYFGPTDSPPAIHREFKVDYTLTIQGVPQRILGATVWVNAGSAGPGVLALPAQGSVAPETFQVYERMILLPDDRYQAYVDSVNLGLPNLALWPRTAYHLRGPETAVSGIIEFAPALQQDPLPTDITMAKVDYRVFDWQILVFDVEVPPGGVVELPVRNLKSAGYKNPPRQPTPQHVAAGVRALFNWDGLQVDPYGNLIDTDDKRRAWALDPRSYAYVIAVDRQSGDLLTDNELAETGGWPANPWMRRRRLNVDYKEGLLFFNYDPAKVYQFTGDVDVPDRSGRTYRIFCRTENDWAVQLSLAARQYLRSATGVPGDLPVGLPPTAVTTVLTYGWDPRLEPNNRRQLYFPLNDSGQAVSVDYYYDDGNSNLAFVQGEAHTIGRPRILELPDGSQRWVCPLSQLLAYEPFDWGPISVRGLSLRARTTWVTTGRSQTLQDLVYDVCTNEDFDYSTGGIPHSRSGLRESWHQVIVSAYLTRAPI